MINPPSKILIYQCFVGDFMGIKLIEPSILQFFMITRFMRNKAQKSV